MDDAAVLPAPRHARARRTQRPRPTSSASLPGDRRERVRKPPQGREGAPQAPLRRPAAPRPDRDEARALRRRARRAGAEEGRRAIRRAARRSLQDVIGEHQDACVAEARIRELAARQRGQTGLAAGRLVERQQPRKRAARARVPRRLARARQGRPRRVLTSEAVVRAAGGVVVRDRAARSGRRRRPPPEVRRLDAAEGQGPCPGRATRPARCGRSRRRPVSAASREAELASTLVPRRVRAAEGRAVLADAAGRRRAAAVAARSTTPAGFRWPRRGAAHLRARPRRPPLARRSECAPCSSATRAPGTATTWSRRRSAAAARRKGRRQAMRIADDARASSGVTRLVSSPYVRCVQTLEPAAERLGLEIEERAELAEGASAARGACAAGASSPGRCRRSAPTATCSRRCSAIETCKKGSIWVVAVVEGGVRPERYRPAGLKRAEAGRAAPGRGPRAARRGRPRAGRREAAGPRSEERRPGGQRPRAPAVDPCSGAASGVGRLLAKQPQRLLQLVAGPSDAADELPQRARRPADRDRLRRQRAE